jgi:hypothetical protein
MNTGVKVAGKMPDEAGERGGKCCRYLSSIEVK